MHGNAALARRSAFVALLALGVACGKPKTLVTVGGAMVIGGVVMLETGSEDRSGECGRDFVACVGVRELGGLIALTGILMVAFGVVAWARPDAPSTVVVPDTSPQFRPWTAPPPPATTLPYSSPLQRQLAIEASEAAARGDCLTAVAAGNKLAPAVRLELTEVDPAFARCLGPLL